MSYKNDSLLVIVNKYGKASGDAKAELYEVYDKIRDITVSGPTIGGSGYGAFGSMLLGLSRMIAPGSFMPALDHSSINVPGTSFSSPMEGGNSIVSGGRSSLGLGGLGKYPGFPGGAAPINYGNEYGSYTGGAASLDNGIGSMFSSAAGGIGSGLESLYNSFAVGGYPTGGAASAVGGLNAPTPSGGYTASGFTKGTSWVVPMAGVVSGIGGLASSLSPYFGPFGILAGIAGNMANGYGGAVLNAYQTVQGRILNNADTILSQKVRNIEAVCKQLDTQSDILRKALKEGLDGDGKLIQNL
ncbi:MAG: hypothetical protein WCK67_05325 [bacterium]